MRKVPMRDERRTADEAIASGKTPGRCTLTQLLSAGPPPLAGEAATTTARSGTQGAGAPLPHAATIQQLFGRHDISQVRAHRDDGAAAAARQLGAKAYTHGNDVVFDGEPDLHTAAHEAAHVVQQRAGIQLEGGVGRAGDVHERHADAVADRVVAGQSAEALLDQYGASASGGAAVQYKQKDLQGALGLDDLPVATAYFALNPARKKTVSDFVRDANNPAAERERVLALWNRGYPEKPSGYFIDIDKLPATPKRERDEAEAEPVERSRAMRRRVTQHISYSFWNMERLGKTSDNAKLQRYVDYVLDILETYHPTFMALEEMGDAVTQFGHMLQSSNLFARYRQHARDKQPALDEDFESTSEACDEDFESTSEACDEDGETTSNISDDDSTFEIEEDDPFAAVFANDIDLEDEEDDENKQAYQDLMDGFARAREEREEREDSSESDDGINHRLATPYEVRREYSFLPGPEFRSGNFREYYPLIFDKAVVIGTPELLISKPRNLTEIRGNQYDDEPLLEPMPIR